VKDGLTHTIDLTKVGIQAKILIFGEKDAQTCGDLMQKGVDLSKGLPSLSIDDPTKH
jgi:hypothetical protein